MKSIPRKEIFKKTTNIWDSASEPIVREYINFQENIRPRYFSFTTVTRETTIDTQQHHSSTSLYSVRHKVKLLFTFSLVFNGFIYLVTEKRKKKYTLFVFYWIKLIKLNFFCLFFMPSTLTHSHTNVHITGEQSGKSIL